MRLCGFRRFVFRIPVLFGAMLLGACNAQFLSAYNDGEMVGSLGDISETILLLGDRLADDPENRNALNQRGNAYITQKEYGLALTDLNRSIALDPDQPEIIYNRIRIYQAQGLHALAISEFSRALRQNNGQSAIKIRKRAALYHGRAMSWFARGDFELALADLDYAVRLDPNLADAWATRGLTLETFGRTEDARQSFRQALKVQNGQRIARAGLVRLMRTTPNANSS